MVERRGATFPEISDRLTSIEARGKSCSHVKNKMWYKFNRLQKTPIIPRKLQYSLFGKGLWSAMHTGNIKLNLYVTNFLYQKGGGNHVS